VEGENKLRRRKKSHTERIERKNKRKIRNKKKHTWAASRGFQIAEGTD